MTSKYVEDIRRIVGIDVNQSRLGTAEPRGAIGGRRGIAYQTPDAGIATTSGSTGTVAPGGSASSSSKTVTGQLGQTGQSVLAGTLSGTTLPASFKSLLQSLLTETGKSPDGKFDPKNPQNGVKTAATGSYDAKAAIDGANDGDGSEAPKPGKETIDWGPTPSYNSLADVVHELTGLTDCDSGKEFSVRFEDSVVPPADWLNDETPPRKDSAVDGDIWRWTDDYNNITYYSAGWEDFLPLQKSLLDANEADPPYTFTGDVINDASDEDGYTQLQPVFSGPMTPTQTAGNVIDRITSAFPAEDETTMIISEDYAETEFPEDGSFQLKRVNGRFQPSSYENPNDLPARYANPSSNVYFCFDSGMRTGQIAPTADGGNMFYETDGNGDPTGIATILSSDGTVAGYTDAAGTASYKPVEAQ